MQITRTDIDQLNATLNLHVEPSDYEGEVDKQIIDIRKKANIPGFRKGLVPKGLIRKMYIEAVMADVINKVLSDQLFGYISENKLNILGDPLPNTEDDKPIDFKNDTEFDFKFDIALAPEFDILPTAKDKVVNYQIEVTDEMVQKQIDAYAQRYGKYSEGEAVEAEDVLHGELTENTENGVHLDDAIVSPSYLKDEEQKQLFFGKKVGDEIVFNPKKATESVAEVESMLKISHEQAEQFEADVTFKLTSISRYTPATIDQELFNKVYGEGAVATEDEFRARVRADIEKNMEQEANYRFGIDARAMVLEKMKDLQFPTDFLKRWLLATRKDDNLTEEKIDADMPQMIDDLKWQLAKNQISEANNIEIKEEDMKAQAREIARMQFMQYGLSNIEDSILDNYANEMLKREDQARNLVARVEEQKVLDVIKAAVKLQNKKISLDKFNKLFEAEQQ